MLIYAVTIFVSAFLLFEVQPVIGKFILPWFGGTPAVWTTCMLMFQGLLLLGYGYAHFLIRVLSLKQQRRVHLFLLALAVGLLSVQVLAWRTPLLPSSDWKPLGSAHPAGLIIEILFIGVSFPFFLLSTTGPLLQAWFSKSHAGVSPYRLYALSNLGSMLALLSYPVLVEPNFTLRNQALLWTLGFLLYVFVCGVCAIQATARKTLPVPAVAVIAGNPYSTSTATSAPGAEDEAENAGDIHEAPGSTLAWWQYALWLVLATCASVLLLAVTNQMCQEVAVIPFLWILPLCLYLLTFILCFEAEKVYSRGLFMAGMTGAVWLSFLALDRGAYLQVLGQVLVYSITLFCGCMVCHGEVVRLKPSSQYLTSFYLMLAAGGALGGLLVGIVSPGIFNGLWELPLGLWLCCFLMVFVLVRDKQSWLYRRPPWPAGLALLASGILASFAFQDEYPESFVPTLEDLRHSWRAGILLLFVVSWLVHPRWKRSRPERGHSTLAIGCLIGALGFLAYVVFSQMEFVQGDSLLMARNFYGVLVVKEEDRDTPDFRYRLRHGRITHGFQFQASEKRRLPTSYYGLNSGVGLALTRHPRRLEFQLDRRNLRIGVIGLGAGTIASFAQPDDSLCFYEINPKVVELSLGQVNYFSYLKDCLAKVEVVLGDARISLERELAANTPRNFDVLAIDAFSSDAIPVHLLTREAMSLYLKHLRMPDGILAIHISNRNVDLKPVVWELADHFRLASALIESDAIDDMVWKSTWMLLSKNPFVLAESEIAAASQPRNPKSPQIHGWTDDYSNLFQILEWR